jgi:SH3 domain
MEKEFILNRIEQTLQELYKKKLISGQTFQITRDLISIPAEPPKLLPRKNAGPPVTQTISIASPVEEKRETRVAAPTNSNIPTKNNINTLPNSAPKPQPNSIEKPNVPVRMPLPTPSIPTRSPLPTPIAPTKQSVDTKPLITVKPALPSKPPPSLQQNEPTSTNIAKTSGSKPIIQGFKPLDSETTKPNIRQVAVTPPPSIPSPSSKPKRIPKYTAVRAFPGEQDGDLALKIGDLVKVVEEVDSNWFRGEVGDRKGIFPKNFVVVELE